MRGGAAAGRGPGRRAAVAVVLACATAALSGCAFITPELRQTGPVVEGTTSVNVGPVQLRGLVLVASGAGPVARGSLVLVAVNEARFDVDARLAYPTRSGERVVVLPIPAQSEVSRGTRPGEEQLVLEDLTARTGGVLPLELRVGARSGSVPVPVLTDSLPQYAGLTPSPSGAASTGSATPVPLPGS